MLLQDEYGSENPPFSSYQTDLVETLGVQVVVEKLDFSDSNLVFSSLEGQKFDFIIDNWSKTVENVTFTLSIAESSNARQFVFVSSAGIYEDSEKMPIGESGSVKESAARKVEIAVEESGMPYTFVRPQVSSCAFASFFS